MRDLIDLTGTRVLVTGGTQGIGAAAARRFADAGATVVIAARSPVEGTVGHFLQADLATAAGVADLARRAQAVLGGIDVVLSAVGSQSFLPDGVLSMTDEDWARDLDINLLAAVRLDRFVLPVMIEQRSGVIIHVTSGQARLPGPSSLPYAAAKAALTTYSKGLANEVGRHGIRVNSLVPGLLHTSGTDRRAAEHAARTGADPAAALAALLTSRSIPLGRPGAADDAARLAVFLASPAAGYLTGSQFIVDGGLIPTV